MRQYHLMGDVETEAQMPNLGLLPLPPAAEGLENYRQDIRRNGRTLIGDLDEDISVVF